MSKKQETTNDDDTVWKINKDFSDFVRQVIKGAPSMYNVVIHDTEAPLDEYIDVLMKVFHHTSYVATDLATDICGLGQAVIGTYTYDVAETIVQLAYQTISEMEYEPMNISLEPETEE